jgi:hypothetical protein
MNFFKDFNRSLISTISLTFVESVLMDFDLKNKSREKLEDYHSTDFVDHDPMKNDNEIYEE